MSQHCVSKDKNNSTSIHNIQSWVEGWGGGVGGHAEDEGMETV